MSWLGDVVGCQSIDVALRRRCQRELRETITGQVKYLCNAYANRVLNTRRTSLFSFSHATCRYLPSFLPSQADISSNYLLSKVKSELQHTYALFYVVRTRRLGASCRLLRWRASPIARERSERVRSVDALATFVDASRIDDYDNAWFWEKQQSVCYSLQNIFFWADREWDTINLPNWLHK